MKEAEDPLTGTLRDLKVDDRDLPLAKNYYDYSFNLVGRDINPPWARQMWVALKFFGEICPWCSNKKWLNVMNVPKNYAAKDLPEHLVLLENGKCPKCKRSKRKLVRTGRMLNYQEAVLVWGQRCVVGGTVVLTENGPARIGDLAGTRPFGFSAMQLAVHNGTSLETTSDFFIGEPEYTYEVSLSNGYVLEGTADHPIYVQDKGFVKLPDLENGDPVEIHLNQQVYGKAVPTFGINLQSLRQVPKGVLAAPRSYQAEFLKALLFYGHTIYMEDIGDPELMSLTKFLIKSENTQIVQDVSAMLNNMGVYNEIVHNVAGSGYTVVTVASGYEDRYSARVLENSDEPHTNPPDKVLVSVQRVRRGDEPKLTYDFTLPDTHRFVGNGIVNHNSGKSTTVANMSGYHTHRFLKFPKFSSMTTLMQAATPLAFTFVSLTFGKAVTVLWEPFQNIIQNSTWYQNYFEMLDHYGAKYGVELYAQKKEFLKFYHKKLNLAPSHPNKSILRGETRFGAAIDELGLFPLPTGNDEEDEQSERANADEAHKSLTNSLLTVQSVSADLLEQGYNHVPGGYMFGVSSPMSERDKVMRLLKDSQGEEGKKYIFGSQMPTWEINPGIHRTTPMIALAYEKNYAKADRDFGANPPRVDNQFIMTSIVREGIFIGGKNSHLMSYDFTDGEICGTLRRVANTNMPSLMSIDAGEVDNSFSITVFHFDFVTGKTICTTVVEIIPQKGRRINHNKVYKQILLPLGTDTNTKIVIADRWNSIDLLQRLAVDLPGGAKVQQITPKRKDFDAVVTMLENKNLLCPTPELPMAEFIDSSPENYRTYFVNKPVAHLAHQITTVRDMGPGKSPEKGTGYTDDTFRSFALGASKIHHPKIQEILQKAATKASKSTMPRAAYVSRGGYMR